MLGAIYRGIQRLGHGVAGRLRADQFGSLVVQDGGARFQEAVLAGRVWIGANPAGTAVTSQAGLSATTPALTLFNPVNSPVDLVLWHFECVITASPAGAAGIMLAVNYPNLAAVPTGPTSVTNANITNAILGQGVTGSATAITTQSGAWGQCYRVATLSAAPVAVRYCFGTTGASGIGGMSFRDQIDGALVVPPGIAVSVQTTSAAALICAFCWEEVYR